MGGGAYNTGAEWNMTATLLVVRVETKNDDKTVEKDITLNRCQHICNLLAELSPSGDQNDLN